MLSEHSLVVLRRDVPSDGLSVGDVGTLVASYESGQAYEVEFVAGDGSTIAVVTLEPDDIRPMQREELLHIRRRDSA